MQAQLERLRQRREEEEMGFTLIELLIVIVILGILAAIVVFAVQNLTQQSSNASCQSDWKTVEVAAESYKAQMGAYPVGTAAMLTTATSPTSGQSVGPWLKDTPGSAKYSVVVGTSNLPAAVAAAAAAVYTTPAPSTTDGIVWIGTPGGTAASATTWTAGDGASVTSVAGPPVVWTAHGTATQLAGTSTASAGCTAV